MKRLFDFLTDLLGLALFFPLFIIISFLIKIDEKGLVFLKQKRVGRGGVLFVLLKFRTMRVLYGAKDGLFEPGNVSSITLLGSFLRWSKLDELQQLINVLLRNISLVGPRPEVEKWVVMCPVMWKKILSVKPGMTDKASVIYRNEESVLVGSENSEMTYEETILPRKLEIYEDYVANNSFFGDLKLIFETMICIFF
jgi:lipopolysaccharide/colanic/teichoic acid biosynthesis glycosyltransferase